ncbi:MAG: hypothetical protein NT076_04050 [Candidatus Pacearchaeota archaeon]|nr:hypothetical protein [Candidatus Pacearchaeota archaeon]
MIKELKREQILLVIGVCIAIFLLVYSPHFKNRFPLHIDEWHQITEAYKLRNGDYTILGKEGHITMGFEFGMHFSLFVLSYFINIILAYQYFPAIWAVLSALVLFYVVYRKTEKFELGLLAIVFFASIKSNTNLLGLWFFTPLTFSIPFIFLYVYLFSEGLEKQNKKFIIASLAIMVFLLFFHAVSVLFAIPFLIVYALFHWRYIKSQYKFFSWFVILPLVGVLFYVFMQHLSLISVWGDLLKNLRFDFGWGVSELNNSFLETYSYLGYILAAMGFLVLLFKAERKKYLAYLLWPVVMLISIWIFKLTGASYLSPYQRNMYYLVIILPLFSAVGFYYLAGMGARACEFVRNEKIKSYIKNIGFFILLLVVLFFVFRSYYVIPKNINVYYTLQEKDYQALKFLETYPEGKVMANALVSGAIYSLTNKEPVASIWFYGNRTENDKFFAAANCQSAQSILDRNNVSYILSQTKLKCNWQLIYNQSDFIYKVK